MRNKSKQLSNPFSTGGGGSHFEAHVQASYLTLMLTGGYAPCMPCWPIIKIKTQGKIDGFDTDDLIVYVENPANKETRKLLGQIKHSIQITQTNTIFSEVIQAAWNDFNNPDVFTKGKDIFGLITGPINKTDFSSVQWILNLSKNVLDASEFFRYVNQANFSPSKSGEKLEVFRCHLKESNNNTKIPDETLYSFLKHFYLIGYDLGKEDGVVVSLLQSHISQFKKDNPKHIWGRIVDFIQSRNQIAGTITIENIPEDIKNAFKQPIYKQIPEELLKQKKEIIRTNWNHHQYATDLALMNMIGAWNENNEKDIEVINCIVKKDSILWIPIIREILQIPDSNISLFNGIWEIKERNALWEELGQRIFDSDIEQFKKLAVKILTEKDPSFEHQPEVRYLLSFQDKTLRYSSTLRRGVVEGLALLGNQPKALIYCSRGKADSISLLTIREIFNDADWKLWGSLNDLLPVLAEACPNEFLAAVESTLNLTPCPFDELFSQEGNGISGTNYMTGLLWALEALAWDEELLVRVCIILGGLASRDPGGNWSNRPSNSLSSILLPWMPQTIASFEKQKIAIATLHKEFPKVAWNLLIKLLPNKQTIATGTYKPIWRNTIPKSWEKGVNNEEYWSQISSIAEIAVSIACYDVTKLCVLIDNLEDIPKPSFDKLLEILSDEKITSLPEEDRLPIWHGLISLTSKHRKFHYTNWALDTEILSSIEVIADILAPKNPINLFQHLFSDRDFELYEESDNWEEQSKKLKERRQIAIVEILKLGGLDAVLTFAEMVGFPNIVGNSLGMLNTNEFDSLLLPKYLTSSKPKAAKFLEGFIWSHYYNEGWAWIDNLNKIEWTAPQINQFLLYLPFCRETWNRVADWLGKEEVDYWSKINANPYQAENDLEIAIDKFLLYGRPHLAVQCLSALLHRKQYLDKDKIAKSLLMTVSLQESIANIDYYETVELIKVLQEDPIFDENQLFQVEWSYLQFLDHHHGAFPKLLETRLATDPDFFCEVVRILYRSKKEDITNVSNNEESKNIAMKVWRLLREWKTPPGSQSNGSFDEKQFLTWLQHVKESCIESGHWEVAQVNIGEVLIHSPADQNGLWINQTVAEALNSDDGKDMRDGFRTAFFNSRGVHTVDPTGKPEKELADHYRQRASDVELAGYHRLAITLRGLAESYYHDAERIIEENEREYR
jgi:hypothetical protein